eukprot:scaffold1071_cov252-Pinguiococcus_pyrenoidosus.AAC.13
MPRAPLASSSLALVPKVHSPRCASTSAPSCRMRSALRSSCSQKRNRSFRDDVNKESKRQERFERVESWQLTEHAIGGSARTKGSVPNGGAPPNSARKYWMASGQPYRSKATVPLGSPSVQRENKQSGGYEAYIDVEPTPVPLVADFSLPRGVGAR